MNNNLPEQPSITPETNSQKQNPNIVRPSLDGLSQPAQAIPASSPDSVRNTDQLQRSTKEESAVKTQEVVKKPDESVTLEDAVHSAEDLIESDSGPGEIASKWKNIHTNYIQKLLDKFKNIVSK